MANVDQRQWHVVTLEWAFQVTEHNPEYFWCICRFYKTVVRLGIFPVFFWCRLIVCILFVLTAITQVTNGFCSRLVSRTRRHSVLCRLPGGDLQQNYEPQERPDLPWWQWHLQWRQESNLCFPDWQVRKWQTEPWNFEEGSYHKTLSLFKPGLFSQSEEP